MPSSIVVGVDASRNRSGGAIAHLLGIMSNGNPVVHGIREVHVWSYRELLNALPDAPWLVKHNPEELERSLVQQVLWQYVSLPKEARRHGCDIVFYTDAGAVFNFRPAVVMSQDMLSFEPQEMARYGFSLARLRSILLRGIQSRSMKRADGVIFLTKYAARRIQNVIGESRRSCIIPHGVGTAFRRATAEQRGLDEFDRIIRCLYVSNSEMYKHQWMVVRAISELRRREHNVSLLLVGGGSGRAQRLLDEEITKSDPHGEFVEVKGFIHHEELPILLAKSDLFVFASSCESMPVTLLEAMAGGLPIACSDRGPMPEILKDGGVYFDPENSSSISAAVEKIITDRSLRASIAKRAKQLSAEYSWERCASETWDFLRASFSIHSQNQS